MKIKLVSIIMAIYKEPYEYVKLSIDSMITQTYNNFEFIIINDNPEGEAFDDLIKSYSDNRIKYHRNRNNLGLTKSLNLGIKLAKGEFIARMDADDISFSTRLQDQVDFLNLNSDIYVVGGFAELIDEKGNKIGRIKEVLTYESIKIDTLFNVSFIHPTVMFRTDIFSKYNMYYDENYTYAQDFELWSRIVFDFKSANIPKYLIKYRTSKNQISTSKIIEQTDFFLKVVIKQLKYLGIEINDDEKKLIKLMTRNIKNQTIRIDELIAIRKLLFLIYVKLTDNKKYNKKILIHYFSTRFSNNMFFFKGDFLKFCKEFMLFQSSLETSVYTRLSFVIYLLKIRIKIFLRIQ